MRSTRIRENEIAIEVLSAAHSVHAEMGPGLMETVYCGILERELVRRGHAVRACVPISIVYQGMQFQAGFYADLIVDGLVLVDIRSLDEIAPIHQKQARTFVRLAGLRLGLQINFGAVRFKEGVLRIPNGLPD